jgi:hypothetical protein
MAQPWYVFVALLLLLDLTWWQWPGSRLSYIDIMESPRFEDYDIEYMSPLNPLEFMGNGFAPREFDGRDLSYYLGLVNGKDRMLEAEIEI